MPHSEETGAGRAREENPSLLPGPRAKKRSRGVRKGTSNKNPNEETGAGRATKPFFDFSIQNVEKWKDQPVAQGQRPPPGTPNTEIIRRVSRFHNLWTDKILGREQMLKHLLLFLQNKLKNKEKKLFSNTVSEK
jgi:hypothetical protein